MAAYPSGRTRYGGANEDFDLHIKLLMLGDTGVGKTCLLLRYAYETFSTTFITTIGIDFKIKHIDLDNTRVKLQIWDTAGQERFRTITLSYFKGAHGILLVYDVIDRETFESIAEWLEQIKEHADAEVNVILVGNKCDVDDKRQVSVAEGQALADEYSLQFFETSARNNINVDEAFRAIAKETKERLQKQEQPARGPRPEGTVRIGGSDADLQPENPRRRCC